MNKQARPLVAISSCLLGHRVRYDGKEKRDNIICQQLSAKVEWLPICPEVAIGLSVPRPPIQLVQQDGSVQILGVDNPSLDVTERLASHAREMANAHPHLCGYIMKSRSPSCGLGALEVRNVADEVVSNDGVGEFARVFQQLREDVPVIDEFDFRNEKKLASFIQAVEERFATIPS